MGKLTKSPPKKFPKVKKLPTILDLSFKPSDLFVKISEEESVVRLIGKAVCFDVVWFQKKRFVIPLDYIKAISDLGHYVQNRYAVFCFDRISKKTPPSVKILEGSYGLFSYFDQFFSNTNVDPGGLNGPDWSIKKVNGPDWSIKKFKGTRFPIYNAVAINDGKSVPFTEEEEKAIKENKMTLSHLYMNDAKSIEKLKNFGLLDDANNALRMLNKNKGIQKVFIDIMCPICKTNIDPTIELLEKYPIVFCPNCHIKFKN